MLPPTSSNGPTSRPGVTLGSNPRVAETAGFDGFSNVSAGGDGIAAGEFERRSSRSRPGARPQVKSPIIVPRAPPCAIVGGPARADTITHDRSGRRRRPRSSAARPCAGSTGYRAPPCGHSLSLALRRPHPVDRPGSGDTFSPAPPGRRAPQEMAAGSRLRHGAAVAALPQRGRGCCAFLATKANGGASTPPFQRSGPAPAQARAARRAQSSAVRLRTPPPAGRSPDSRCRRPSPPPSP